MRNHLGLAMLAALLAAALPVPAAAQAAEPNVNVLSSTVQGDAVNLTVSSSQRTGYIEVAGLYVGGSLASSQLHNVWIYVGWTETLSFVTATSVRDVELRLTFAYDAPGGTISVPETQELSLQGAADLRPVRTTAAGGNVTFELHNFGDGAVHGLMASLVDDAAAPIGDPYYRKVGDVAGGATANVTFALLAGGDRAKLMLETPFSEDSFPVLLSASAGGSLSVEADSPTLQGAPGGKVDFTLRLKNSGAERVVDLAASGLPAAYTAAFAIQGVSTSNVRIPSGETKVAVLSVTLPSSAQPNQTALPFTVVASSGAVRVETGLSIVVAGQARLELVGRNWYVSTEHRTVSTTIEVRNGGTAAAYDVEVTAAAPAGWEVTTDPQRIDALGPGEQASVAVTIRAPSGSGDGRYVVDVGAEAGAAVARERSLSVELQSPPPARWPWALGAVALAGAAVFMVVKMRRK